MIIQYNKMDCAELVEHAKKYTIDGCHPQIIDELISRLSSCMVELGKKGEYIEQLERKNKNLIVKSISLRQEANEYKKLKEAFINSFIDEIAKVFIKMKGEG